MYDIVELKMNTVQNILKLSDNYETKLKLKALGPPKPELKITQVQKSFKNKCSFNRNFNHAMYNAADWLCGCEIKNAFFCFTCLVMRSNDASWTLTGVTDLKNFHAKVRKHKSSEKHINSGIDFSLLGKLNVIYQLDNLHRLKIKQLNEDLTKNHYVLGKLIDCLKYFKQNENDYSNNHRDDKFMCLEFENILKEHAEKTENRVFLSLSKAIQNELLNSIYEVCLTLIKNELEQTQYVSLEVNEITDRTTLSQLALLIRYELNGKINERFIGFLKLKDYYSVEGVIEAIFSVLNKIGLSETPEKLIAQSYDGALAMSCVQNKIRAKYKNAYFVHSYSHRLSLIIEQCTTGIKQIRLFFSILEGFSTFFTQSTERTLVLNKIVKKRIPTSQSATTIKWNFNTKCVTTVHNYKKDIAECLQNIIEDDCNDYKTVRKAVGLKCFLEDDEFLFWLEFFNKILLHCEILFNQLQQNSNDQVKTRKHVLEFELTLNNVKSSFDLVNHCKDEPDDDYVSGGPSEKRPRYTDTRITNAKEVCDIIIKQINGRFLCNDYLSIAVLFEPTLFSKHRSIFPENEFKIAIDMFNLNLNELRSELNVLYNRTDLQQASGALTLLNFIYENNLVNLLPETYKLLQIIVTIPMMTAEEERCLPTLNGIKTFRRCTGNKDRFCALAMCSIEKQLLTLPNFNTLVIDYFCSTETGKLCLQTDKLRYADEDGGYSAGEVPPPLVTPQVIVADDTQDAEEEEEEEGESFPVIKEEPEIELTMDDISVKGYEQTTSWMDDDNLADNPRKMFLLSLLPDLEQMSEPQMRLFKKSVLQLTCQILDSNNEPIIHPTVQLHVPDEQNSDK